MNLKIDKSLILFPLIFVCFFYSLDPYDLSFGLDNNLLTKYLPFYLSFIYFLLAKKNSSSNYTPYILIAMTFSITVFYMSIEKIQAGLTVEETFITRILLFFSFIFFVFSKKVDFVVLFLRYKVFFLSVFFILNILQLVKQSNIAFGALKHIYHEEIILVYVIALLYIYCNKKSSIFTMLLIALTPAFSFKNTGFFLSLLLIVYILLILNNEKRVNLSVSLAISSVLLIAFTGVGFLLYDYILPYLPSGSPEVRLETYSFRINTFLENVFFGDYAGSNMLLRIGYLFWGFDIPSHSDVLDILAFFGLFGAFVFYYPVFLSIFRAAYTNSHDLTYVFIIAGFVFLMAFNPIINQPKLIVVYYYILATAYEKFRFKIKL